MKHPHFLAAAALALLAPAFTASAQDAAKAPDPVTFGGDFRARIETFDHVPGLSSYTSYFRFRTRAFVKADAGDFTFYARAVNEWRRQVENHGVNRYPWTDELVFDQVYAEFRNILGENLPLRARVGRQEITDLGSMRVIADGTPSDGSRTPSFNAARFTLTPAEKMDIDFIGVYNRWYDECAIGGLDDHLTPGGNRDLNGGRADEAGTILYLTDKSNADLGLEGYYIWKHETTGIRSRGAADKGRDTHTLGGRLLPKFTDTLTGELEAAGQLGRTEDGRDISAFMLHAGATQSLDPIKGLTPYLMGACTLLSGDKDETDSNVTAWNPVWGRQPQYGDLSGLDCGYWYQNLVYPHVELGFKNAKKNHTALFQTGPMFALCDNGSDDGNYRGWHFLGQYNFPIIAQPYAENRNFSLSGHIEAGALAPGDYYADSTTAYFLRFQLMAKF